MWLGRLLASAHTSSAQMLMRVPETSYQHFQKYGGFSSRAYGAGGICWRLSFSSLTLGRVSGLASECKVGTSWLFLLPKHPLQARVASSSSCRGPDPCRQGWSTVKVLTLDQSWGLSIKPLLFLIAAPFPRRPRRARPYRTHN